MRPFGGLSVFTEFSGRGGAIPTTYPCVPGHEIVGRVTKVGAEVTKYKTGDIVGAGCISDSDRTCPHCRAGFEQFSLHHVGE